MEPQRSESNEVSIKDIPFLLLTTQQHNSTSSTLSKELLTWNTSLKPNKLTSPFDFTRETFSTISTNPRKKIFFIKYNNLQPPRVKTLFTKSAFTKQNGEIIQSYLINQRLHRNHPHRRWWNPPETDLQTHFFKHQITAYSITRLI